MKRAPPCPGGGDFPEGLDIDSIGFPICDKLSGLDCRRSPVKKRPRAFLAMLGI
jgi:hypothetical protein